MARASNIAVRAVSPHLTKNQWAFLPTTGRDNHPTLRKTERTSKKKPATIRCGLESNFLRRRLEETGATIAMPHCGVCFIVAIADIHHSNNCCGTASFSLIPFHPAALASSASRHLNHRHQSRSHRPWRITTLATTCLQQQDRAERQNHRTCSHDQLPM